MPWIQVAIGPSPQDPDALVGEIAATAANALGLDAADVVVLLTVVTATSSGGAVVSIAGRDRGPSQEAAMTAAVQREITRAAGLHPDLVAIVRL